MVQREFDAWDFDIDFATGRKPWGRTWKPDPLLDFDEYGRYVGKPSDILNEPLEVEAPIMRRKRI